MGEHNAWHEVDLDERKARVQAAVETMHVERDTLALLLAWEISKPWRLAVPTSTGRSTARAGTSARSTVSSPAG